MKRGPSRFENHISKLERLLYEASKEHNPALFLYKNDARTPFFMLEGLSRLYKGLHNKKKFSKLTEQFKQVEDMLGQIDYYDWYANEFLKHPMVPVHIREYMQAQAREKIQALNDVLTNENWISRKRLLKIRRKLNKANWLSSQKEMTAIEKFYEKEINNIKAFVKDAGVSFTDMETHVHEYRRALRWLSIYATALHGGIQLAGTDLSEMAAKEYLLPEIINSKYNKLPDASNNNYTIVMDKNYFYAMSWVINELGIIKDEGLQYFAVTEALQQTAGYSHEEAFDKSFEILGVEKTVYENLLQRASDIVHKFTDQQFLDKLVIGVTQQKFAY